LPHIAESRGILRLPAACLPVGRVGRGLKPLRMTIKKQLLIIAKSRGIPDFLPTGRQASLG